MPMRGAARNEAYDRFLGERDAPPVAKVVQHAKCLMDYGDRARAENAKDDEPRFSVFGTGALLDYNAWGIGGWTAGADPYVLDEELGMWLETTAQYAHLARDSVHEAASQIAASIGADLLGGTAAGDGGRTGATDRRGSPEHPRPAI